MVKNKYSAQHEQLTIRKWGKPTALIKTLPGFIFSSYPQMTRLGAALIPHDQAFEIYQEIAIENGLAVIFLFFLSNLLSKKDFFNLCSN